MSLLVQIMVFLRYPRTYIAEQTTVRIVQTMIQATLFGTDTLYPGGCQNMIWGISDIFEHVNSSVDDTNII